MVASSLGMEMQSTKPWRSLSLTLGILLATGCAPDEEMPLPEVVWEGQAVRVRMQDPMGTVCGDTFETLDRHAELVREAMLLEGDGMVEYSIGDEDFVDAACAPLDSPRACAEVTTGHVFTSSALEQHEIVHAVRFLDPSLSLRSSAIEEGLATLFGSDDHVNRTHPLDVQSILADSGVIGREGYFRAGHTMAALLRRHGTDAFRHFDVSSVSLGEDEAFVEAFGESKEEFALIADAQPVCEVSQWWIPLSECDGEPIVADPGTEQLILRGEMSCSATDMKGPVSGWMWTSRHFRLDRRTSELHYRFEMPEDATLEIVSCEGGCPERFAYIGGRYDVTGVLNGVPPLEPGEYFLRMSRPVTDDDEDFEIVLH